MRTQEQAVKIHEKEVHSRAGLYGTALSITKPTLHIIPLRICGKVNHLYARFTDVQRNLVRMKNVRSVVLKIDTCAYYALPR